MILLRLPSFGLISLSLPHNIAPLSASLELKPFCFPPLPGHWHHHSQGSRIWLLRQSMLGSLSPPGGQGREGLKPSEPCGNGLWVTHKGPKPWSQGGPLSSSLQKSILFHFVQSSCQASQHCLPNSFLCLKRLTGQVRKGVKGETSHRRVRLSDCTSHSLDSFWVLIRSTLETLLRSITFRDGIWRLVPTT